MSQRQERIPKREIFESAFSETYRSSFEKFERNDEEMLYLAYRHPEGFKRFLLRLENDVRLYLSKDCVKNKQGQFLEMVKRFVSLAHKKLPGESEKVLERILDLILDLYSNEKKENIEKNFKTSEKNENESENEGLPSVSEEELIKLARNLRLYLEGKNENKEIFEKAKEIVSKFHGKLPKESRSAKILERILNLILDFYLKKRKKNTENL